MKEHFSYWVALSWHKDFGNPEKELQLLKQICFYVEENFEGYDFVLDLIEEGYMSLELHKASTIIASVQIVDINPVQFGFFGESDDAEYYFNSAEQVGQYLL